MKVKILKKSVKEGVRRDNGQPYRIASLFVSFEDDELFNKIVAHLKERGATIEQIGRFCKPSEYRGETSYAFGLNCSSFTFERVHQFGILDANIIFKLNDNGFINASIKREDSRELVTSYTPPESEVVGWFNTEAPPPIREDFNSETSIPTIPKSANKTKSNFLDDFDNDDIDDPNNDLPF